MARAARAPYLLVVLSLLATPRASTLADSTTTAKPGSTQGHAVQSAPKSAPVPITAGDTIIEVSLSARAVKGNGTQPARRGLPDWKLVTDLLNAVAGIIWPVLWLIVILLFRAELRALLRRLRTLRVFGQEFDLDEEIDRLGGEAKVAAEEVANKEAAAPQAGFDDRISKQTHTEDDILKQAVESPRGALMLLSADLERELRTILLASGWAAQMPRRVWTMRDAVDVLMAQGTLPVHIGSAVRSFGEVRNKVVHGGTASDADVLRTLDIGLMILRTIRAIPVSIPRIAAIDITLYADDSATQVRDDVVGIVVGHVDPRGRVKDSAIRPTTRRDYYRIGMRVTWEWNLGKTWGPTWCRDPKTRIVTPAWVESAEFAGRDLDES